ncbi:MAG: hypothetical protein K9M01_04750 [Candidatus Omnitrophica bacterium]|nr:hypothetical protein [Candidatus Omnitrophota bacterium]
MKILGIGFTNHDQSVCLIEDEKIIFNIELERITRIKHALYNGNNEDVYKIAKSISKEYKPDIIAYSFLGQVLQDKKFDLYNIATKDKIKDLWFHVTEKNLYYIDHHQAHASYALFTSPFKRSDILVYDGSGLNFSSVFFNRDGVLEDLSHFKIGVVWGKLAVMSFGKLQEGKLMGLSAYGKENAEIYNLLKRRMFPFEEKKISKFFEKILNRFELKDIAYNLQRVSEEETLKILKERKTSDFLCLSGGVALNGYINKYIEDSKLYKEIYIPPACNDSGLALGAALHANYILNNKRVKNNIAFI